MTTSPSPAIVLVDDEPDVLIIMRRLLYMLAEGYDVIAVRDGAAALAQVAQRPVALVITDYQMPDMDGLTLTAAITAAAPTCAVALITGYLTPEIRQRARLAGADFSLSKPFSFDQFEAAVQTALAH